MLMKLFIVLTVLQLVVAVESCENSCECKNRLNTILLGPSTDTFDDSGSFWYQAKADPNLDLVDVDDGSICPSYPPYIHILSQPLQDIFTQCEFHDFTTRRAVIDSEVNLSWTIFFVAMLPHNITFNVWLNPESTYIQNGTSMNMLPCSGLSCLPPADIKALECLQTNAAIPLIPHRDNYIVGIAIPLSSIAIVVAVMVIIGIAYYAKKVYPRCQGWITSHSYGVISEELDDMFPNLVAEDV